MCAISGIVGLTADAEIINKMLSTMGRRGPDAAGVFQQENVTLLHARLAVIDPLGGGQPMHLEWNNERFTIIYNGELYNTEELRYKLFSLGHTLRSHSDTEVVLRTYAEFGARCVEELNGIFSFAVWEHNSGRLFLARDRIGVKPLFYCEHADGFLFASEIKTILAYPGRSAVLDAEGASQLILLGPGRLPGSGVLQGIHELEPGFCGYYDHGRLKLCRYWKLTDREHIESFEETSECVRYLVTDAIRRQMVSDVPLGTFLSGGLDSSIITAVCAEQMCSREVQLKTFSVDYENNDLYFRANKFQPNTDDVYIKMVQEALSTDHYRTVLTPEDLDSALEDATIARDLPGMADVDFSLLAFCKEVRKHVTVALSGECADEIFGGYPWYRDPEVRTRDGFPWAQNTSQRKNLLSPEIRISANDFVMDAYRAACADSDILPGTTAEERRMKEMVNLNFRYFMQTLLDRKDRMSMYHSLEVRVPFCDYRIAEYLYGVPWEYKNYKGREKGLLRHAMQGLLPQDVLYRKKSPYPKTFDPRYEKYMSDRLAALFADSNAPLWNLVSMQGLKALLSNDSPWPWYGQLMRKPQIMAYFCQMDFWLRHYSINFAF